LANHDSYATKEQGSKGLRPLLPLAGVVVCASGRRYCTPLFLSCSSELLHFMFTYYRLDLFYRLGVWLLCGGNVY